MSSLPYISEIICANRKLNSEKREIDNEKLINELRCRPGLWDQGSLEYGNRPQKVKHWEEIAEEMDRTVPEVKGRWKILKDSFNREIRNMAKGAHSFSKWMHFDQMSFLLKGTNTLLLPRVNAESESDSSGYLSQSILEVESPESQNAASNSGENEQSESSYITVEDLNIISPKKKKRKNFHLATPGKTDISATSFSNVNEDQKDSSSIHSDHGNEDYLFLMSLLPTFQKLSPKQKMLVKIKLMQNMFDASFGDDNENQG